MNNVLILGGTGFIGKSLIKTLERDGYNVFYTSRRANDTNQSHLCVELNDTESLMEHIKDKKIDIVIHLVSNLVPANNEIDYIKENTEVIIPTCRLIDALTGRKIKFIYFSSAGGVYGDSFTKSYQVSETDACQPTTYYGRSKLAIEDYLFKSKLDFLILRPSNVYGRDINFSKPQGLIGYLIKSHKERGCFYIFGDGNDLRDYIYIDDLCSITSNLLKEKVNSSVLNICSGKVYSINNVIGEYRGIVSNPIKVKYAGSRKCDVRYMELSNDKLLGIMKFKFTSLRVGLKYLIDGNDEESVGNCNTDI
ncbi:TPA: NAD-dependent epimerase/dehydratase family protein [Vibrio parahaemolyticus]